ncbi:ribosome biogenesis GTPase Der [Alloalcanivorax profundimaris]|uniref:ribosome biogenesis GTPase Der n=1 Tax=Alloalcanivorax profundimaris TaxID=2735259 RepID=UPI000C5B1559|nr:ribosome biogenesis GTPase Der [Alloalcanivorax profundimaris]MAO59270.1 ribosome biogenesis GTPase Der [Alcanivorax sp.]MBM1143623.1 ribosome biogenesis GTPase Der [Alcanivorax sp. ZXX171]MAY09694.1 ribosome biogenesis GTPase Der [Alcanivorax sp.]MBF1800373.1 ribosome biogenesis GTPase Der [Alloalcanivorax profundimaris]MBI54528.1 ribosome biogenesis GTPase Der [Alcanivorax sp.]|tara:strand:- start:19454 stop:20863 length:1410 start_codon:yes stop_codon:yes gene_type:complete
MKPVIALVGRPNVGKSTLFNRLTRTRDAIVADFPGLTRDRQYGDGKLGERPYTVVDTGGIGESEEGIDRPMTDQARQAVGEADAVLFLVDGRAGLTAADEQVAMELRKLPKPVFLVVNKTDGLDPETAMADFYALGLTDLFPIAAAHGRGVRAMVNTVLDAFPDAEDEEAVPEDPDTVRVAVLGRPNVGKSTLINRILGEERVIVYDHAGTTRDSIEVPFTRQPKDGGDPRDYVLIDTAGIRRRGKVHEAVEKFSVIKALQAVDAAQVVVLVVDARDGITDQDLHLLGYVLEAGRALVVAVNKWDGLEPDHRQWVKTELERRLHFVPWVKVHFISALHGTGVGDLFGYVERAWESAFLKLGSNALTRMLQDITHSHPPPRNGRFRAKLRYAHLGGSNPPTVVIHGNRTESLPNSYQRYLENRFRELLKIEGSPIRLELKSGDNPYEGRKNQLTDRQIKRKRRMMKHVKK